MVRSRAAGFAGLGFRISGLGFRASSRGFGYPHSGGQTLNDPTLKFIGLVENKNIFYRGVYSRIPYYAPVSQSARAYIPARVPRLCTEACDRRRVFAWRLGKGVGLGVRVEGLCDLRSL